MNIKAWLVTGSKWWNDCVTLSEDSADARIASRKSTGDRKVPLVDASELSRAYALIEEMREALSACQISIVGNLRAMRLSGPALDKADAFLAERVK